MRTLRKFDSRLPNTPARASCAGSCVWPSLLRTRMFGLVSLTSLALAGCVTAKDVKEAKMTRPVKVCLDEKGIPRGHVILTFQPSMECGPAGFSAQVIDEDVLDALPPGSEIAVCRREPFEKDGTLVFSTVREAARLPRGWGIVKIEEVVRPGDICDEGAPARAPSGAFVSPKANAFAILGERQTLRKK